MSVIDGRDRFAEARQNEARRRDIVADAREARADARERLADRRDAEQDAREALLARRRSDQDARQAEQDERQADQDAREQRLDASGAGCGHLDVLTRREREVLALIAQGLSNETIAVRLCLSMNTVKSIIRGAYRKAEVDTRTQAVLWYLHGTPPCGILSREEAHVPSVSSRSHTLGRVAAGPDEAGAGSVIE